MTDTQQAVDRILALAEALEAEPGWQAAGSTGRGEVMEPAKRIEKMFDVWSDDERLAMREFALGRKLLRLLTEWSAEVATLTTERDRYRQVLGHVRRGVQDAASKHVCACTVLTYPEWQSGALSVVTADPANDSEPRPLTSA